MYIKKSMKLIKVIGYGVLGLFLYFDFVGPNGLMNLLQNVGVLGDVKFTEEASQYGALLLTTRLVYTSITLAVLEVIDNLLDMLGLYNE